MCRLVSEVYSNMATRFKLSRKVQQNSALEFHSEGLEPVLDKQYDSVTRGNILLFYWLTSTRCCYLSGFKVTEIEQLFFWLPETSDCRGIVMAATSWSITSCPYGFNILSFALYTAMCLFRFIRRPHSLFLSLSTGIQLSLRGIALGYGLDDRWFQSR
jgi:hypothetical protein